MPSRAWFETCSRSDSGHYLSLRHVTANLVVWKGALAGFCASDFLENHRKLVSKGVSNRRVHHSAANDRFSNRASASSS